MKKVFLTFLLLLGCSEVPKKNNNEVLLYEAQITGICTDAYPSQAGYPAKSYNVSGDIRVSRIRIENLYMYETFIMPTEENLLESIKKAEDTFGDNIDNVSFDEINKIMKEPDLISIPSLFIPVSIFR